MRGNETKEKTKEEIFRLIDVGLKANNAVVWIKIVAKLEDLMKTLSCAELIEVGDKAKDFRVWEVVIVLTPSAV